MTENGDPPAPGDTVEDVEQVLQASDAIVTMLHARGLVPRLSAAALAIALGRVCGHYKIDMEETHALARALADSQPQKEVPRG